MAGALIESVDLSNSQFVRQIKKLDPPVLAKVKERIGMLLQPEPYPEVLHMHKLKNRTVRSVLDPKVQVDVWTIHVTTANQKASFTIESKVAYFRTFGAHQDVDKTP